MTHNSRSNGKWWYPSLVPEQNKSLLYKKVDVIFVDNLVVCRKVDDKRSFAYFDTYLHYLKYRKDKGLFKTKHYEVLLKGFNRKIFFDCDIDRITKYDFDLNDEKIDEFLEILCESIINVCNTDYKITLKPEEIIVFTSHGKNKYSLHLVVDNYYMIDNLQCKLFFDKVRAILPDWMVEFIDSSVYSSRQQVRLMGSHATGDRVKIFKTTWKYKGADVVYPEWDKSEIFEKSLVGFIGGCKKIDPKEIIRKNYEKTEEYEEIDVDKTISFCKEKMDNFPFKPLKLVGPSIILKRLQPSHCDICKTKERGKPPHTGENPFVTVFDGRVRFYCRRHPNDEYMDLGNIEEKCLIAYLEDNLYVEPGSAKNATVVDEKVAEDKKIIKDSAGKLMLNKTKNKEAEVEIIVKDAKEPLPTLVRNVKEQTTSRDFQKMDVLMKQLANKAKEKNVKAEKKKNVIKTCEGNSSEFVKELLMSSAKSSKTFSEDLSKNKKVRESKNITKLCKDNGSSYTTNLFLSSAKEADVEDDEDDIL